MVLFGPAPLVSLLAASSGYFLLDHDQRHTLHGRIQCLLSRGFAASANVYYGSGFTDGSSDVPGAHLRGHTTADFSASKSFGERVTLL